MVAAPTGMLDRRALLAASAAAGALPEPVARHVCAPADDGDGASQRRLLALISVTTGTFVVGCACATSGQAAADPTIPLIKSRRRIALPEAQEYANNG